MMKNTKIYLGLIVGLISTIGFSQDTNTDSHNVTVTIPEVAILDLEATAGTAISLGPTAPTEAGLPLTFPDTDNTIWLNYSSVIGSVTEPTRTVTAQISSGTLPGGTVIKVVAAADAGNGDGTMGIAASEVTLSGVAQNVITGIGSAYTGDGVSNGHNLTYTLDLDSGASYADLDFDDSTTLSITYTLSDN